MTKINYRQCDICNNVLKTDIRCQGFTNGWRIFNRLFNRLDICSECMNKLKLLSIDASLEKKIMEHIITENSQKYDNLECLSAYLQGAEDATKYLSHNRLYFLKKGTKIC